MSFLDDAKKLASEHSDQVEQGIEKGGDFVDSKTGGKYAKHVDTAQEKAGDYLTGGGRNDDEERAADEDRQN